MQFATAASQFFKFYKMKKLSRSEMKKVMGGNETWHPATVVCNDGARIESTNYCANSVGVCNNHSGFRECIGEYYT